MTFLAPGEDGRATAHQVSDDGRVVGEDDSELPRAQRRAKKKAKKKAGKEKAKSSS